MGGLSDGSIAIQKSTISLQIQLFGGSRYQVISKDTTSHNIFKNFRARISQCIKNTER
jgi:hypothetical protein